MSGGQAQKKQSFLQGVAVLTAATIIVKLLGFIYKVPLQNILQERGFGYFNTAYDVYNVLLMISTTGLPVAVSRMISQAQALDNYAQIRKIYSVSMKVFLTIGVVGSTNSSKDLIKYWQISTISWDKGAHLRHDCD